MPASSMYRRPLGRSSAHRQALLKNLVTALIKHECISTTYAKAKEAQRQAEKLITLGKRNTDAARTRANDYVFEPLTSIPKVFGALRERYATRPGGYTRILQSEPLKDDQAHSAVLCLVDGPKDVRFQMTARTLLRQQEEGQPMNEITAMNVRKVTRFRKDGLDSLVEHVQNLKLERDQKQEQEKKQFEEKGIRYKYTAELSKKDPRWKENRGPGSIVRRRIGPDDDEFPNATVDYRRK